MAKKSRGSDLELETPVEGQGEKQGPALNGQQHVTEEAQRQHGSAVPETEAFGAPSGGGGPAGTAVKEELEDASRTVRSVQFDALRNEPVSGKQRSIEVLQEISLPISVELGRTTLLIKDILDLGPGSVVELNRLAGEPVDVLVNGRLVARGEVVVVEENFGVRITAVCSPEDRAKNLA